MKAVHTDQTNTSIQPRLLNTNIIPLPVWSDGSCCISIWELTDEDIKNLIEHRRLYLMVGTPPDSRVHPMVGLSSENIIPNNKGIHDIITNLSK